jgi:DNA-binding transcriptional MerR regulator
VTQRGLTAGEAAQRLGIAVTTLRSWHQRYGLGPTDHEPPSHRRYNARDISRLETMRQLTSRGVPAAKAARIALAQRAGVATAPEPDGLSTGPSGAATRGLMAAAMRLDPKAMAEVLSESIGTYGVVDTWDQLVRPVLTGIGRRHEATGLLIDVEHLLTRCVSESLSVLTRSLDAPPPRTLLACADEEQHTLPLEALAAALATRGVGTRLLGARVPAQALLAVIRRTAPAVVVCWSQTAATSDPRQLAALQVARPTPAMILAAGPGWDAGPVPADIARPTDLVEALDLTLAIVAGGSPE